MGLEMRRTKGLSPLVTTVMIVIIAIVATALFASGVISLTNSATTLKIISASADSTSNTVYIKFLATGQITNITITIKRGTNTTTTTLYPDKMQTEFVIPLTYPINVGDVLTITGYGYIGDTKVEIQPYTITVMQ